MKFFLLWFKKFAKVFAWLLGIFGSLTLLAVGFVYSLQLFGVWAAIFYLIAGTAAAISLGMAADEW